VTLGDSITEGFTWQLWVSQSLAAAGHRLPDWINAGVGGETTGEMLARVERDVLDRKPGRVFISAGVNDAFSSDLEKFLFESNEILVRLKKAGVPVCVLTTTALGPKHGSLNEKLAEMNDHLRRRAAELGFAVADAFQPFREAVLAKELVLESDDVHLTLEGYRILAGAVLKAIDPTVPLTSSFDPRLEPGVPARWEIRKEGGETPVWNVTIPDTHAFGGWWHAQERRRGYLMDLKRFDPNARRFTATSEIELSAPEWVKFRIGGAVETLCVNGEAVTLPASRMKWGVREVEGSRLLPAGRHRIDAVVGDAFFVSCSKDAKRN
jgi:acyl-CoA thioesterase-1